jgi:cytochrome bd-type quinol oxidase subunit 1
MDPVLLARIQFALTIGFHFIFPPLSIGLAWIVVIVDTRDFSALPYIMHHKTTSHLV